MNDNTADATHPTYREIVLAAPGVRHVRDWTAWVPDLGLKGILVLIVLGFVIFGWGYWKGWSGRGESFEARAKDLAERVIAEERAKLARRAADLDALRRKLDADRQRLDAADQSASRAADGFGDEICFSADEIKKIRGGL